MERVVFLLCIPEEDDECNASKIEKKETLKDASNHVPTAAENTLQETDGTVEISEEHNGTFPCATYPGSEDGKKTFEHGSAANNVTFPDVTTPSQDTKEDKVEMAEATKAVPSEQSISRAAAENTFAENEKQHPTSSEQVQPSLQEVSSLPLQKENQDKGSSDVSSESKQMSQNESGEQRSKLLSFSAADSAIQEEQLGNFGADDLEASPLITKQMIGEELVDDFWDFKISAASQTEAELEEEKQTELFDSDSQTNLIVKERQSIADSQREQEHPEIGADDVEDFCTCPSTSEHSKNTVTEKSSELGKNVDEIEHSPSGKFITVPVPDGLTPISASSTETNKTSGETEAATVAAAQSSVDLIRRPSMPHNVSAGSMKETSPVSLSSYATEGEKDEDMVDFLPRMSLRKQVRDCLRGLGVKNVAWRKCQGDKVWQVTFVEGSGVRCEEILLKLGDIGVGRDNNSSVSVLPVSIHVEKEEGQVESETTVSEEVDEEKVKLMEEKASEFQKSITSRLVVRQVEIAALNNAVFTFDYLMLIILASVIAVMGLVENSSVVLVASMLISPLMGPILAGTIGTVTKNNPLRNLGIRSELFGLGICLICGFLCGLVPACLEAGSLPWRNADEWPTTEMTSRGMFRGLLVGIMIALPSGAGVALSVLGGHTGSLVGVAISASLLPPAVNAGMLWSSALVAALFPPPLLMQTVSVSQMVNGTLVNRTEEQAVLMPRVDAKGLLCHQMVNNDYVHTYSCQAASDFMALGAISLLLTILNILCIFLMGIVVLKIKEVVPNASTERDKNFFKKDIQVAREYYTTAKGPESALLGKKWLDEYKVLRAKELGDIGEEGDDTIEFQQILQTAENSTDVRDILRYVPQTARPLSEEMAPAFMEATNKHIRRHQEFESVYHTVTGTGSISASNKKPVSVYHTIRTPLTLVHNPLPSMFVYPHSVFHYDRALASPTTLPVSSPLFSRPWHLPQAPILEEQDPDNPRSRIRLRIPDSSMPKQSKDVESSGDSTSRLPSSSDQNSSCGLQSCDDEEEKAAKKPMSILKKPKKSPRRTAKPKAAKLEEGVPLLTRQSALSGEDQKKAAHSD